ncbi:MAG: AAA-like domain-containing protein [Cyanobacteria bacterium P01_H01_bin.35]
MKKEVFQHIFSSKLTEDELQTLKLFLAGHQQKKIADSMNWQRTNVSKKLKAIAEKFGHPKDSSYFQEFLVEIFTKYQSHLVCQKLKDKYVSSPSKIIIPDKPEKLDSPFYIERHRIRRCSIESECYDNIEIPDCLIRIKAPKQMGKTSLLTRIQAHAIKNKYESIYLRFDNLIEPENIKNINNFLKAFNKNIKGRFPDAPSWNRWDDQNAKISCTEELEALLYHLDKVVVLLLDEVDEIFNYPEISRDFFIMLRSWYEASNHKEIWENLRVVIAYSTEYHGKLDIHLSPFNVGLPIELKEFNPEQVTYLAELHQLPINVVDSLMSIVGGHPYLIRLGLYKMSADELTIEELLKYAATESGIYQQHLSRHLETLSNQKNIKAVFSQILKANSPLRLPNKNRELHQLEAMGLITIKADYAEPRCELYRKYFQERLL